MSQRIMRLEHDDLLATTEGDRIRLRPIRPKAPLKNEHDTWVYEGESPRMACVGQADVERSKRLRALFVQSEGRTCI